MSESIMSIKNLAFGYNKKKLLFEDFSLELPKGNVVGLLGKNGAGKSTLLYLMSGLLRPLKGSVVMNGCEVSQRKLTTLSDMFIVPEEFSLPRLTLMQFVRIYSVFYPRFSEQLLESCLKEFGLSKDVQLDKLSMGQKKQVYVCFALATNTSLLLLDEPTNGLDIPSKSQFRKVLASGMTDEKTVVISTHQVKDVDRLLDHVLMIERADILLDVSVSDITDKLYFGEQAVSVPTEHVLYVQPSAQGNSIIRLNTDAEESQLQLELLFNAVLADKEKIRKVFHP
ncbi:MAG: ABC transporter ATP-binding protein [Bacteroidetes bacterium]|uniref:ABC transporter ATP-binding protein n=1 Tax=Candidatus Gallipaludibacter merdavium TaxID=2840839 RepID=A0A9D9HTS7_9BACT|nr:ABC transporter ATP-binding protein [Candidatus Gallipaludibacter merdavium]